MMMNLPSLHRLAPAAVLSLMLSALPPALHAQTLSPAQQTQYDQAVSAYENKRFDEAFRLLQPLAQQGHAKSQYNLGTMYANGEGTAQDYARAKYWLELAAKQGHADAANALRQLQQ